MTLRSSTSTSKPRQVVSRPATSGTRSRLPASALVRFPSVEYIPPAPTSLKMLLAQHQPPLDHLLPALVDVGIKTVTYLKAALVDPLASLKQDELWKDLLDTGSISLVEVHLLKRPTSPR